VSAWSGRSPPPGVLSPAAPVAEASPPRPLSPPLPHPPLRAEPCAGALPASGSVALAVRVVRPRGAAVAWADGWALSCEGSLAVRSRALAFRGGFEVREKERERESVSEKGLG
jgi:hypothetical protein